MTGPFASVSSTHLSRNLLRTVHDSQRRAAYESRRPEDLETVQNTRQALDWLDLLRTFSWHGR